MMMLIMITMAMIMIMVTMMPQISNSCLNSMQWQRGHWSAGLHRENCLNEGSPIVSEISKPDTWWCCRKICQALQLESPGLERLSWHSFDGLSPRASLPPSVSSPKRHAERPVLKGQFWKASTERPEKSEICVRVLNELCTVIPIVVPRFGVGKIMRASRSNGSPLHSNFQQVGGKFIRTQ